MPKNDKIIPKPQNFAMSGHIDYSDSVLVIRTSAETINE